MTKFDCVWDAIEDTREAATEMKVRSGLMIEITARIRDEGWSNQQAAEHAGITRDRVDALIRGKISEFTVEDLSDMVAALRVKD